MMTVDQRYETAISPSGIITLNTAWINDETVERFAYKRLYGTIVGCPQIFSEQVVMPVDPGYPAPKKHISGEYIQKMRNAGYKHYDNRFYSCAGMDDFDKITVADIAADTDIRKGDKCYFPPTITEPSNRIGDYGGKEMYKISVEEIICIVRNGEILTQGPWCLVEPDMEDWSDIMTKAGIVKKPKPEARIMRGHLRHSQKLNGAEIGDLIVYAQGCDWTIKIEGKEYYAIQREDILVKIAA